MFAAGATAEETARAARADRLGSDRQEDANAGQNVPKRWEGRPAARWGCAMRSKSEAAAVSVPGMREEAHSECTSTHIAPPAAL